MLGRALLVGIAAVLAPLQAQAHFVLVTPDASMSQDAQGYPQKLGPCGNEGGGTQTGKVTVFRPGETIAVTIDEVVTHPGHYRVALAVNDRSELPPEPRVTPKPGDPCSSAVIQSPPTFPILADNMLPHTHAFGGPQTFMVTLPADITCTQCTLQVLEFMSSHGAPCFYHHCADIAIQGEPEASPTPSATPTNTPTPTSQPPDTSTPTQSASTTPAPTDTPTPTPTPAPCVGDCSGTQTVAVSDLITLLSLALGSASPGVCPSGLPLDGEVDVPALIQAVNHALNGCGG